MTDEKAELLEQLLIWWHRLHKTSNKKFFPLFWNRSRYLVLMGGGGSGKAGPFCSRGPGFHRLYAGIPGGVAAPWNLS